MKKIFFGLFFIITFCFIQTQCFAAAPTITSITPSHGHGGGETITLIGTGFESGDIVNVGTTPAHSVIVESSTKLMFPMPAIGQGKVDVFVTGPGGTSNGVAYTFDGPAPVITKITPPSGPSSGGTYVTLTGTSFVAGSTLLVGGNLAKELRLEKNNLIFMTPSHNAGNADLVLINPDGQSYTCIDCFYYYPMRAASNP